LKNNVIGGYNLSCIGDDRQHSCMMSKFENYPSDEALLAAYKKLKIKYKLYSFLERGSDERQYNSPGVDLPITSIFRTMYGKYPEYHTSLDNFEVVTLNGLKGGFKVAKKAISNLLLGCFPKNRIICEPKLDKRGLYPTLGTKHLEKVARDYLNFLMYADGTNSIKKIANILKIKLNHCKKIYNKLKKNNLVT
jgi:aminopeptidase-like protein